MLSGRSSDLATQGRKLSALGCSLGPFHGLETGISREGFAPDSFVNPTPNPEEPSPFVVILKKSFQNSGSKTDYLPPSARSKFCIGKTPIRGVRKRRQNIHNKVAKAAKTNHCRSLVETVSSSWPLCPCCESSGPLVAALPQCASVVNLSGVLILFRRPWPPRGLAGEPLKIGKSRCRNRGDTWLRYSVPALKDRRGAAIIPRAE
jgi:hypothetical protein